MHGYASTASAAAAATMIGRRPETVLAQPPAGIEKSETIMAAVLMVSAVRAETPATSWSQVVA